MIEVKICHGRSEKCLWLVDWGRTAEFENISIATSQMKNKRENRTEQKESRIFKNCEVAIKVVTHV
jgi:hypothetical protein